MKGEVEVNGRGRAENEALVRGKLYVRSGAELTPKQLTSALEHLSRVRFQSAAAALFEVPGSELAVTYQGRHRGGFGYLHRCAINVIASIGGHPVIATSLSYQFAQLLGFTAKTDVRNARIIASRSRSRLAVGADIYAVASDQREAESWEEARFDKISVGEAYHVVNPKCFDEVTMGSSGSEHDWYVMRAAKIAREYELKLRDDDRARAIIDRYQRTGTATKVEKAEWRRIAGKVSVGDLGSIELSYDRASIPVGEPSITAGQAAELLG
jgi:hypothetical protein